MRQGSRDARFAYLALIRWRKQSVRIDESGERRSLLDFRVLAMHEDAHRNNRDKHEAHRFPHFILSLLRGGAVHFDQNAAGLERVYLNEDIARRASHSPIVNFVK